MRRSAIGAGVNHCSRDSVECRRRTRRAEVAVVEMPFLLGDGDLVPQAEVHSQFWAALEIVLSDPGVVGPIKGGVVRVADAPATGGAEQERGEIVAAVGDV